MSWVSHVNYAQKKASRKQLLKITSLNPLAIGTVSAILSHFPEETFQALFTELDLLLTLEQLIHLHVKLDLAQ